MKKETMTIKAMDSVKKSGGFKPPAFRSGKHMTKKDRPRKKLKPREIGGDYDE